MGDYTSFRCSKILGEAGKQEILQQMLVGDTNVNSPASINE